MDKEFLFSILRHLATKGAGVLVTKGYFEASQTEQFAGLIIFAAGLAWSYTEKRIRKSKANDTPGK
jgi:hypothetical protein